MRPLSKKVLFVSSLSAIPLLVLLLKNFVIRHKSWNSVEDVQYATVFWIVRLVITPAVVFYTIRFWVDLNKVARIFIVHITGFVIYSLLACGASFVILKNVSTAYTIGRERNLIDNIISISLTANLLMYLATVFVFYVWEYFEREVYAGQRAALLEKSLAASKLEALANQLNAHFLFNSIHTISSLIMQGRNNEANNTLISLSELLRFSLKENKQQFITLEKELELTRLYLDIQKTRFKERLVFNISCDEDYKHFLVPCFLLQPLAENSIKYGVEPFPGTGTVEITVNVKNGMLFLMVKDNGAAGINVEDFNEGIGLKNTKERLLQLYGADFSFVISPNKPGRGVSVFMELPLKTTEDAEA